MSIIKKSSGRFQDSCNPYGPGSEEVRDLIPNSFDEPFLYHHRCLSGTDEHIVPGYIYYPCLPLQSYRKCIGSEKHFRESAGVEPDFCFRLYHEGLDIREESWIRGRIGTTRLGDISNCRKLPEDSKEEDGHKNWSDRREDISPPWTEVLQKERVRHN